MNNQQFATQSARLRVHSGEARLETLNGRDHVAAPATLVREMVLKGELLPFEEVERTALAWNGSPVTVAHPRDDGGNFLPASRGADAFERHAVGHLFNVTPDPDSRSLIGEVWLDVEDAAATAERLDRDDPAALLTDGEGPLEVSTGYWYRKHDDTGEYDGEEYRAVQKDVQPDHLAVLPNSEGECSLEDGCGLARPDAVSPTAAASANDSPAADRDADAGRLVESLQAGISRLAAFAAHSSDSSAACHCGDSGADCGCGDVAGNQDVGDAVRWESDASAAIGGYRYGVVVDGLQDGPDNQVLVAVYEPTDDGWQNRNEENPMDRDRLEVVGSDGKASLPPIDQLGGQNSTVTGGPVTVVKTNDGTMAYDLNELASASGLSVATLEDMSGTELSSLASTVLEDGGDGSDNDGDGSGDSGGDSDGSDGSDDTDAAANEELLERVARLEAELEEARAGASREDLKAEINEHTDVSDTALEAMSTSDLADLAEEVRPSSGVYAGRRGAASSASSDDNEEDLPETGASLEELGGDA